ncbi:hypothetical protein EVAR_46541_1 [Eumeta japonica]|uniref:Uncharacterized protein n=1 Tax=Eumeta variegata TaxID=151549 RepID=A0A4C1XNN3_EUMVA|nr:hypothetical protein EVAR_46541_1 [Eumeta japonica]
MPPKPVRLCDLMTSDVPKTGPPMELMTSDASKTAIAHGPACMDVERKCSAFGIDRPRHRPRSQSCLALGYDISLVRACDVILLNVQITSPNLLHLVTLSDIPSLHANVCHEALRRVDFDFPRPARRGRRAVGDGRRHRGGSDDRRQPATRRHQFVDTSAKVVALDSPVTRPNPGTSWFVSHVLTTVPRRLHLYVIPFLILPFGQVNCGPIS